VRRRLAGALAFLALFAPRGTPVGSATRLKANVNDRSPYVDTFISLTSPWRPSILL
jgi:hypothetical protein